MAVYYSFLGLQILVNPKWRDLPESFSVRDMGKHREFYVGTSSGAARVCIDEDKNGTLDRVMVNAPISAYMGGPGYRLMTVETTEEDQRKFERANYLLSLENKAEEK